MYFMDDGKMNRMLDVFNDIASLIKSFKQGALDDNRIVQDLLPRLRNLTYVGAVNMFGSALELLSDYEDNVDYQFCKAIYCFESFDHKGMGFWLTKLRNNNDFTIEHKTLAAINIIFANNNDGCFDNSVEWAIDVLEDAVINQGYNVFEAYENLMQELENKESDRLDRYINYLKKHQWENWAEYCDAATVLWNHYRRTDDFVALKQLLVDIDLHRQQYELSRYELLEYDMRILRLYLESRDGRWEQFSISIFRRHEEFLDKGLKMAFCFGRTFLDIVRDGAVIYGRYLNEAAVDEITGFAKSAIERHISESRDYYESLPLEMVRERIFWNEVLLLKTELDCVAGHSRPTDVRKMKAEIYKRILNLCEVNGDRRDYLHWLLIYAEETSVLNETGVYDDELRALAMKLNSIVKEADYSQSVAYYLIFLGRIWDSLGDGEMARFYLRRFELTGASYKVYNNIVQRCYLSLVRKYMSDKDDPVQNFLNDYEYLCLLNSNRDIEEAFIRAKRLYDEFPFADTNAVARYGAENVALLLNKCSHVFLNASKFSLLDSLWKTHLRFCSEWRVHPDVSCEIELAYATGLFRQGNLPDAQKHSDAIISSVTHEKIKLWAYVLKGQVETSRTRSFKLSAYIDAITLAEEIGDYKGLAYVYHKIGVFLGKYYNGLGLSFLRKANCIYERLGMIDEMYEMQLLIVQTYVAIIFSYPRRYGIGNKELLTEARRILKEFPRSVYRSESSRAFHDRLTGIIECNVDRFNDSLLFYMRTGAYPDVLITLGAAVCTMSINNHRDEAVRFAREYLTQASAHDDVKGINDARAMFDMLNTPDGVVCFTGPEPPYKETTLFNILDHIALDEELWAIDKSILRSYYPRYQDEGKCIPFSQGDVVTLNPVGLLPFQYYRGQNTRYSRCLPTLYRPGITDSKKFVERLKFCEFYLLLETHPILNRFKNTFSYVYPDGSNKVLNLNVYHLGLAQHYGICTELIDVTSDKWVAAFFAATKYCNGQYSPFDGDGNGVFYFYKEDDPDALIIQPIGIQPFSRPGEQSGYACVLGENEDFEERTTAVEFRHHKEINEFIFNYTNRAKKLFPGDILEIKASVIRNSHAFSRSGYDMAVKRFYANEEPEVLKSWLSNEGVEIVNEPIVEFSVEDMDRFACEWPQLKEKIRERILILNLAHREADGIIMLHSTRIKPANAFKDEVAKMAEESQCSYEVTEDSDDFVQLGRDSCGD